MTVTIDFCFEEVEYWIEKNKDQGDIKIQLASFFCCRYIPCLASWMPQPMASTELNT
jgi:hypothetical protein